MADKNTEIIELDPSATSISNDETLISQKPTDHVPSENLTIAIPTEVLTSVTLGSNDEDGIGQSSTDPIVTTEGFAPSTSNGR